MLQNEFSPFVNVAYNVFLLRMVVGLSIYMKRLTSQRSGLRSPAAGTPALRLFFFLHLMNSKWRGRIASAGPVVVRPGPVGVSGHSLCMIS